MGAGVLRGGQGLDPECSLHHAKQFGDYPAGGENCHLGNRMTKHSTHQLQAFNSHEEVEKGMGREKWPPKMVDVPSYSPNPFPHCPGHWSRFPASLPGRCGHITEFQPVNCRCTLAPLWHFPSWLDLALESPEPGDGKNSRERDLEINVRCVRAINLFQLCCSSQRSPK